MKPLQIIELEKLLGFELRETKYPEDILNRYIDKLYLLNDAKDIIGLNLHECYLEDVSFLGGVTNLNWLDLIKNKITGRFPLQPLTTLTKLNLGFNNISDISFLENLKALQELYLGHNKISDISPLTHLTRLKKLSLELNQISDISALQELTNLTKLNLYGNKFSDISALKYLKQLTSLNLGYNQGLDYISLQKLPNLRELTLWNNQISDISFLEKLPSLIKLDLWGNKLSDISSLKHLINLTNLDLSNNQVSNISPLQGLINLVGLNLESNQISEISLEDLSSLIQITVEGNPLKFLSLRNLPKVVKLDLSSLKLNKLELEGLTKLSQLKVSKNPLQFISLKDLPKITKLNLRSLEIKELELQRLETLSSLDLKYNQISDISFLENVEKLKILHLWENQISDISPIRHLSNLIELHLDGNQISDISPLQNLTVLQNLYLRNNQISDISFLQSLIGLKKLYLDNNQISDISLSFLLSLSKLKELRLYKNPIKNIPKEIFDKDRTNVLKDVRNHLKALDEDGKANNDQIKMLLLGNSTAGKTSLINFLQKGEYVQKRISTHGIENLIWQPFKDEKNESETVRNIKVSVWDFGGQEFYHNTHSLFFSDNAIYLVLFEEKTNHQGKKNTHINLYENGIQVEKEVELEHFEYSYWLENVKYLTQTQDETCLLIQNKCDINNAVSIDDMTKQNYGLNPEDERIFYISVEKAFEKDKKFLLKFEMFKAELLEHIKKNIATFDNSKKWQQIKNEVQTNWKDDKVLDYSEYVRRCKKIKSSIDDRKDKQAESQLDTLTKIMREQGIILRYKNISQLKDKIFVNPAWLTDCIYKVLDYSVIKSEGKFDQTHLEKISQTIQPQISAGELLALLKNFNLIFEIDRMGKQWFICPQFLPDEIKGESLYSVESHRKSSKIQYSFTLSYPKFLPISTFLKFLAKHGKNHIHYWYSKNEFLFIEDNKAIDAKCVRTQEERSITISIQDRDSKISQKLFEELLNIDYPSDLRVSVNEGKDFVEVKKLQSKIKAESQATQIESIENKSLNLKDFWFLFGKEENKKITSDKEKESIQKTLDLLLDKKSKFEQAFHITADTGIRFTLKKQIEDLETEIEEYRNKLKE